MTTYRSKKKINKKVICRCRTVDLLLLDTFHIFACHLVNALLDQNKGGAKEDPKNHLHPQHCRATLEGRVYFTTSKDKRVLIIRRPNTHILLIS